MSPQALLEHLAFDEIDGDWAFRLPVESCDLWNRAIYGIERFMESSDGICWCGQRSVKACLIGSIDSL
ncbi:MAG: hypothetical protein ACN6O5_18375 [Achromobacter sp.]|uniref:hypothetical protein n=1 Tax=Achromobacter sp. TaxID=134375 RepID=UPI003CFC5315